jgi:hypothetical protein
MTAKIFPAQSWMAASTSSPLLSGGLVGTVIGGIKVRNEFLQGAAKKQARARGRFLISLSASLLNEPVFQEPD